MVKSLQKNDGADAGQAFWPKLCLKGGMEENKEDAGSVCSSDSVASPLDFLELNGINLDYSNDREIRDAWTRTRKAQNGLWRKIRPTVGGKSAELMRTLFHVGLPISVDGIRFKHPTDNFELQKSFVLQFHQQVQSAVEAWMSQHSDDHAESQYDLLEVRVYSDLLY